MPYQLYNNKDVISTYYIGTAPISSLNATNGWFVHPDIMGCAYGLLVR